MELFVLGIDYIADNTIIAQFIEEYNLHYPAISGIDGSGSQIHEDYEIPYTPSVILIAPDHSIVEQELSYSLYAQDFIDVIESYGVIGVGIDENIKEPGFGFSIYPNPVKQQLYLQWQEGTDVKQIDIYELTGQKVFSLSCSTSVNNIDVSAYHHGIYLLSVEFKSGKRITKTFMKQ